MITKENFDNLRIELSIKSKNGLDFILAASVIWIAIAYVWTLPSKPYDKSILTFIVGSFMLPLALLVSKMVKTTWTNKNNPLQPPGLWLNFAQLFYFPERVAFRPGDLAAHRQQEKDRCSEHFGLSHTY
ncbi:MAG: DUF7010 family protein [Bacteroidota bacterium]